MNNSKFGLSSRICLALALTATVLFVEKEPYRWYFLAGALVSALVAGYRVWQKERQAVIRLHDELEAIKAQKATLQNGEFGTESAG